MWKIRSLVVLVVLVGVLVFGAVVAHGGWWWNTSIDVEGVEVRTFWTVEDDPDGATNYHTKIRIDLPKVASAEVVEKADTESVKLKAKHGLGCLSEGIEAKVTYKVKPQDGAIGKDVKVWVTADDQLLGEKTGKVGKKIKLDVFIPATCSGGDGN